MTEKNVVNETKKAVQKMRGTGRAYYEDDYVTLYHGDFLDISNKILPCKALVTDPPFAMAGGISNGRGSETSDQFFSHWWRAVAKEIVRIIDDDGAGFVHCDWQTAGVVAAGFNIPQQNYAPLRVRQMLYWNRKMIGQGRPFRNQVEMIAFVRGGKFKDEHIPKNTSNLIEEYWYYGKHVNHPAEKSPVVTKKLVEWSNPDNGVVVDPFAGSGTTLVVCKGMGVGSVGVEREESHCETIARRCEKQSVLFGEAFFDA